MITLTFACGHTQAYEDGAAICRVCGERRVSQAKAPPPRFRGVCVGPTATYDALPAIPVGVK